MVVLGMKRSRSPSSSRGMSPRSTKCSHGTKSLHSIKRSRESSEELKHEDSEDEEPDGLSPPPTHLQQIIELYHELALEVISQDFIGESFYTLLSQALLALCKEFPGAESLSRPYVAWRLLEDIDRYLCGECGISVLATTSVPKPTFLDEPISSRAYDSLVKILKDPDVTTVFRRILEWCDTGGITDPLPELEPEPELELELAQRVGPPRVPKGYSPEQKLSLVPRAARVPTGYTPERELLHAPRRQATGIASPAGAQTDASVITWSAAPPEPTPMRAVSEQTATTSSSISQHTTADRAQPLPIESTNKISSSPAHFQATVTVKMLSPTGAARLQNLTIRPRGTESPRVAEEVVTEAPSSTSMEAGEVKKEENDIKAVKEEGGIKAVKEEDGIKAVKEEDVKMEKMDSTKTVPYATFISPEVFDYATSAPMEPATAPVYTRELADPDALPSLREETALLCLLLDDYNRRARAAQGPLTRSATRAEIERALRSGRLRTASTAAEVHAALRAGRLCREDGQPPADLELPPSECDYDEPAEDSSGDDGDEYMDYEPAAAA